MLLRPSEICVAMGAARRVAGGARQWKVQWRVGGQATRSRNVQKVSEATLSALCVWECGEWRGVWPVVHGRIFTNQTLSEHPRVLN